MRIINWQVNGQEIQKQDLDSWIFDALGDPSDQIDEIETLMPSILAGERVHIGGGAAPLVEVWMEEATCTA